jgi:hypothetical protein
LEKKKIREGPFVLTLSFSIQYLPLLHFLQANAISDFAKKYNDKTKNTWGDNPDSFVVSAFNERF